MTVDFQCIYYLKQNNLTFLLFYFSIFSSAWLLERLKIAICISIQQDVWVWFSNFNLLCRARKVTRREKFNSSSESESSLW